MIANKVFLANSDTFFGVGLLLMMELHSVENGACFAICQMEFKVDDDSDWLDALRDAPSHEERWSCCSTTCLILALLSTRTRFFKLANL